jgi:hypothetical protein
MFLLTLVIEMIILLFCPPMQRGCIHLGKKKDKMIFFIFVGIKDAVFLFPK